MLLVFACFVKSKQGPIAGNKMPSSCRWSLKSLLKKWQPRGCGLRSAVVLSPENGFFFFFFLPLFLLRVSSPHWERISCWIWACASSVTHLRKPYLGGSLLWFEYGLPPVKLELKFVSPCEK